MKYAYKTVDTSTLAGLQEAERLKASGWEITRTGLFLVWFQKAKPRAGMQELFNGAICSFRFTAWQRCLKDARYYVVFMIKPAVGPKPFLAVVDDYGNLVGVS